LKKSRKSLNNFNLKINLMKKSINSNLKMNLTLSQSKNKMKILMTLEMNLHFIKKWIMICNLIFLLIINFLWILKTALKINLVLLNLEKLWQMILNLLKILNNFCLPMIKKIENINNKKIYINDISNKIN
jgi:hypothetical protein